ncbi:ATP-dependent DNA helicase RecG [Olsenella sp. HMSC062G07]|uniref:ATP-dependent DNA helicase RecG n=1 Tax=Olsenella sp. HMSC062G07 TaxID=1739330 RepID=UPI0008A4E2C2|nr:ATP-dependent DNA helicase RecG [Olsenella sp. HMSC062G07]OFK24590.1 ATP-dependent DNA helicase RecG [Olsenella sp. HMSC062G07]
MPTRAAGLSIAGVGRRLDETALLDAPVSRLRYVSGARREALVRMGVRCVHDLLLHVPHRYLDFTRVTTVEGSVVGQDATIFATVDEVTIKRPRPRLTIVELFLVDPTGVLRASFFGQPWLAEQFKVGDLLALSGSVGFSFGFKQMTSPFVEKVEEGRDQASLLRVLPVHPASEGLSANWLRRIMSAALADAGDQVDFLPASLCARHGLMGLGRALRETHFPRSLATARQAHRRLAFDELLCLQLTLRTRQALEQRGVRATRHDVNGPHLRALRAALPFALTPEQETAVADILGDMASGQPMNRLLLGDVGTGKTVVAALALAAARDTRSQAAMMAPTSVLARQYAEKVGPLLDAAGVSWTLITGSTPAAERADAEERVARGETCVVFGTTALISDALTFCRLTLVVIDEQHRFGVNQRVALRRKGAAADLLAMTATPIPRTLALSLYGDLDCSRIATRPRAGAGVTTHGIAPESLDVAWGAVREACDAGRQAYVICPLVDEADDGSELDDVPASQRSAARQVHAATTTARDLARGALRGLSVGLLHGRMDAAQKERAMEEFRSGRIAVLVSTTVVEVGVDVPGATVMVVLDADRFGLATLHQLRGRVGRGETPGVAYLCCAARKGSPARRRLAALEGSSDGFELAELDLRLRHEGEVLGYRQSGGVSLRIADLAGDADLVAAAHEDARVIAAEDPALQDALHAPLALEAHRRFGAYFGEVERAWEG